MRIECLTISDLTLKKSFSFINGNNLIHSSNNSVGKTTLLRLLLYSLGYNIPSTKKFPMENYKVEAVVVVEDHRIRLSREAISYIVYSDKGNTVTYSLPEQVNDLHAKLYNTKDINILDNILGVFYLDQEKGWTLLNRGIVIGSNHFNVEDFIQGLSGRDCSELKSLKLRLEKELNKYGQISNVTKYKESLEKSEGSILTENSDDELNTQIELQQIRLSRVKSELARIDRTLQGNSHLKRFVEEMKLTVLSPSGEQIKVTADNIVGLNDSIDYLIAKRRIKAIECNKLLASILRLQEQRKNKESELFMVDSIADAFDEMVQKFPYGYSKIEEIKGNLQKKIKEVRTQITERTKYNNTVLNSIYTNVIKYAEELGIGDEGSMKLSYLFTSNLKELSGALLHMTVFSFRLAFVLEVKKILGVTLPIILDSPSGKEVDLDNIGKMINILKRDFADHQLIIASIIQYDLPDVNIIEIKKSLLE